MKIIKFLLLTIIFVWVSCSLMIFKGPFKNVKTYLVGSLATTRHGYLLKPLSLFMISENEIQKNSAVTGIRKDGVTMKNITNENFSNITDNGIKVAHLKEPSFNAQLIFINNPKRLQVAVTKYYGKVGQTVKQIVEENKAVAGVNGGAFDDKGWHGTGGLPTGITIANNKIVQSDTGTQPIIGFNQEGVLIVGDYTLAQLKTMNVTQALSFGPALIENGRNLVTNSTNQSWGLAPRTAIGQEKNGTVILLTTDGRGVSGPQDIGASLGDVEQIMAHYGAYTAANLDGGSSTTMVYNNKIINTPSDMLGAREVGTAFIVTPGGKK